MRSTHDGQGQVQIFYSVHACSGQGIDCSQVLMSRGNARMPLCASSEWPGLEHAIQFLFVCVCMCVCMCV